MMTLYSREYICGICDAGVAKYTHLEERGMAQPPSSEPPPIERLPKRRNRVVLGGVISYADGAHSFNCTFRDITDTGARVVVRGQQFPSHFYLINIRDRLAYDANVMWNSGSEVGVSFQKTFRVDLIVDPALKYLRGLWLAPAPRY